MRLSEIDKSFVNGKWTPITAVPKRALKRSVKRGQFGQKHLADINEAKNEALRSINGVEQLRRTGFVSDKVSVRNAYTKRKMDVVRDGVVPGPHVNWPTSPGQRPQIRLANKRTMAEVEPLARKQAKRGAPMTMDNNLINLHEHAHATGRRSVVTRDAAVMNRAWSTKPERLSAVIAANTKMQGTAPGLGGAIAGGRLGAAAAKNNQWMKTVNASRNLGEEARADVMASRKSGKRVVSGHVFDMGSPEKYVRRRRTIERGMGLPQTSLKQVRPKAGVRERLGIGRG